MRLVANDLGNVGQIIFDGISCESMATTNEIAY